MRGDVQAATAELRRASVVNANDLLALTQVAAAWIQLGNFAAAEEVIQAVDRLDAPTGRRLRLHLDRKRAGSTTR